MLVRDARRRPTIPDILQRCGVLAGVASLGMACLPAAAATDAMACCESLARSIPRPPAVLHMVLKHRHKGSIDSAGSKSGVVLPSGGMLGLYRSSQGRCSTKLAGWTLWRKARRVPASGGCRTSGRRSAARSTCGSGPPRRSPRAGAAASPRRTATGRKIRMSRPARAARPCGQCFSNYTMLWRVTADGCHRTNSRSSCSISCASACVRLLSTYAYVSIVMNAEVFALHVSTVAWTCLPLYDATVTVSG